MWLQYEFILVCISPLIRIVIRNRKDLMESCIVRICAYHLRTVVQVQAFTNVLNKKKNMSESFFNILNQKKNMSDSFFSPSPPKKKFASKSVEAEQCMVSFSTNVFTFLLNFILFTVTGFISWHLQSGRLYAASRWTRGPGWASFIWIRSRTALSVDVTRLVLTEHSRTFIYWISPWQRDTE